LIRLPTACLFALFALPVAAEQARVIDGDTLRIGETTYRLHGIDAPEAGQKCEKASGGTWPCGKRATETMVELVTGADVICDDRGTDDYGRTLSVCSVAGRDIIAAMVEAGMAWAYRRFSNDYAMTEDRAHAAGIGVWQAPTQTPWEYRTERWAVAEQDSPPGCPIKGNIAKDGERIYHAPWSPWYSRTKLSPEKGERWFCTEGEALAAGWRAPMWGS
tara:strand:+ start:1907 stop:2560 length:654 start_codon:yes stop_codon:yes gene_type:complete